MFGFTAILIALISELTRKLEKTYRVSENTAEMVPFSLSLYCRQGQPLLVSALGRSRITT
jgi:hypothetical protein